MTTSANPTGRKQKNTVLFLVLALTALAYGPSLGNGFTQWDDPFLILENPLVRSLSPGNIVALARQSTDVQPFVPLTMLSFALEYHLFRAHPFIYHLDNLLLHLGVVWLVFRLVLLMRLGLPTAGLAALIFGLHPMHVESVAWVSERKDVLFGFFYLLSVIFYVNHAQTRERTPYLWSLLCGILSMLAKPMAASLPLMLLVMDWWFNKKLHFDDLKNKIPYLAFIVPIAWVTYGTWARNPVTDPGQSLLIWLWGLTFYVKKFFFPVLLLPLYTLPKPVAWDLPAYRTALLLLLLLVLLLVRLRKDRLFVFACLVYVLSIFFLLPLDDVERAGNFVIVADRYMYLPGLGFCVWLAACARRLIVRADGTARRAGVLVVGLLAAALGAKTFLQTTVWTDNLTLWDYTVGHAGENFIARINRGAELVTRGRVKAGIADYRAALKIRPGHPRALCVLGQAYEKQDEPDQALDSYDRAAAAAPREPCAFINRGIFYLRRNRLDLSRADFERVLAIRPRDALALTNLGIISDMTGRPDKALSYFDRALRAHPYYAEAAVNRGIFLYKTGRKQKALDDFTRAIVADRKMARAYYYRSVILNEMGRTAEASRDESTARTLGFPPASP